MRIYSEREPIPAAVVTLATQESQRQHILFQTRYDQEGFYSVTDQEETDAKVRYEEEPCPETLVWAIKALSVLTDCWSAAVRSFKVALAVSKSRSASSSSARLIAPFDCKFRRRWTVNSASLTMAWAEAIAAFRCSSSA